MLSRFLKPRGEVGPGSFCCGATEEHTKTDEVAVKIKPHIICCIELKKRPMQVRDAIWMVASTETSLAKSQFVAVHYTYI